MSNIKMVDLKGQYEKIKSEIDNAIKNVIDSTAFINGSEVQLFQKNLEKYLGVKHVIPCANGTDALQIAIMALNLKPGDEIITVSFTFVATVEVISLLGLKPIFIDVNNDDFNLNDDLLEKAITPKTKAIIPVHLFGQCADMENILKIAKKYNIKVIEDTAQALGTDYTFSNGEVKKAGTIGDIGTTSFFPSKNLGCFGDGGALFTNDDKIADTIRMYANHGMKVRYYHQTIGINSRLDTIQAAVLNVKLKYLNNYSIARQNAANHYNVELKNVDFLETPDLAPNSTHIFHQYTLKTKNINRDNLQKYLQETGIPAMIYYPVPLHLQEAYKYLGYKIGDFPVTEELCKRVISLPMHTELTSEQLYFITNTLKKYKE
ncbi:MAG: transcriptional regulator [Bacteroidetes bacterium GWA2_30_7]|nr:MAG: transcriptional regulator [Bacteroidetes bacterium GWA2_30_7]